MSNEPSPRRPRTSSARPSAHSRTTCQTVESRVISSDVSGYRNPIIAEAMKVLGYVNCYNRGINMVQDELVANGNGKAEFSFRLITAFEAKVMLAGNGLGANTRTVEKSIQKSTQKSIQDLGRTDSQIVRKINDTPSITTSQLAEEMGMSRIGIQKAIARLKARNIIRRVGPDKGGHWDVSPP